MAHGGIVGLFPQEPPSPRSLKMIVAGSFVPSAAARATSCLDSYCFFSPDVVCTCWWHVKTAHSLIHVDNVKGIYLFGLMYSYDGLAKLHYLVSIISRNFLGIICATAYSDGVPPFSMPHPPAACSECGETKASSNLYRLALKTSVSHWLTFTSFSFKKFKHSLVQFN